MDLNREHLSEDHLHIDYDRMGYESVQEFRKFAMAIMVDDFRDWKKASHEKVQKTSEIMKQAR